MEGHRERKHAMSRRRSFSRSFCRGLRALALAAGVVFAAGMTGAPAGAVEAPPGSKNFTPPGYVPDYFSNESRAVRGGATAGTARSGAGPAVAAPALTAPGRRVATAPRRHPRHHAGRPARARDRIKLARGKVSAHRHVVHPRRARHGTASARRHLIHTQMARDGKVSARRHLVRAHSVHSAKASEARAVHARTRPSSRKAVAAKTRRAPARIRHVARGRG